MGKKSGIVHRRTEIPKARHTIWAQEAAEGWAENHAARRFDHPRADPDDLAAAKARGEWDRVALEGDRIDALKSAALAPVECGPEMVLIAPARGPVIASYPVTAVPDMQSGVRLVDGGYRGRANMRSIDIFDQMNAQASRRSVAAPFSRAQIDTARRYRDLFEWVQAAGIKCASLTDAGGAGSGTDFMDRYTHAASRLRWADARIGDGIAKECRRVRPSVAGRVTIPEGALRRISRQIITRRDLMFMVCIAGHSLSAVLKANGWAVTGQNRKTIGTALRAILDDLAGL